MTSRKNAIPVTLQILHLYDRIRKNLIDVCPRDHHVVQVAVYFTNENYSLNGITRDSTKHDTAKFGLDLHWVLGAKPPENF